MRWFKGAVLLMMAVCLCGLLAGCEIDNMVYYPTTDAPSDAGTSPTRVTTSATGAHGAKPTDANTTKAETNMLVIVKYQSSGSTKKRIHDPAIIREMMDMWNSAEWKSSDRELTPNVTLLVYNQDRSFSFSIMNHMVCYDGKRYELPEGFEQAVLALYDKATEAEESL